MKTIIFIAIMLLLTPPILSDDTSGIEAGVIDEEGNLIPLDEQPRPLDIYDFSEENKPILFILALNNDPRFRKIQDERIAIENQLKVLGPASERQAPMERLKFLESLAEGIRREVRYTMEHHIILIQGKREEMEIIQRGVEIARERWELVNSLASEGKAKASDEQTAREECIRKKKELAKIQEDLNRFSRVGSLPLRKSPIISYSRRCSENKRS